MPPYREGRGFYLPDRPLGPTDTTMFANGFTRRTLAARIRAGFVISARRLAANLSAVSASPMPVGGRLKTD